MKVLLAPQFSEVEQAIMDNAAYKQNLTFDKLCERFPKNVIEVKNGESPRWGTAWHVADENGYPKVAAANWDSSG
jgi:hypothetical protein